MSDNAHDLWLVRQWLVRIAAASVTAFYLHCFTIFMADVGTGTGSHQWTDQETEAILTCFASNKSKIGDTGNFTKKIYLAAAESIPGKTRTPDQVKTKWQGVSNGFRVFEQIINQSKLKSTYRAIQSYQGTSGVHWDIPDNEKDVGKGANVVTIAEAKVWQAMIDSKVCYEIVIHHEKKASYSFLSFRKITQ